MQTESFEITFQLEVAELIYGQVAGFSTRSTEIRKFGSCYILSHLHSGKLEGIANLVLWMLEFLLDLCWNISTIFIELLEYLKLFSCHLSEYKTTVLSQAMQYASPKAIWNVLFGVNRPLFEPNDGIFMFLMVLIVKCMNR